MTVVTVCHSTKYVSHPLLRAVVIPISFLFFLAAWSPPLFYQNLSDWYESWHQDMFAFVCHQQLDRTFFLNGIPLAVCSRCTGIYTGLVVGLLLFSFISGFTKISNHNITRIFFVLSLVIVLDGGANLLQIWHTATVWRFLTGGLWGMSTGAVLVQALIIPRTQKLRSIM